MSRQDDKGSYALVLRLNKTAVHMKQPDVEKSLIAFIFAVCISRLGIVVYRSGSVTLAKLFPGPRIGEVGAKTYELLLHRFSDRPESPKF